MLVPTEEAGCRQLLAGLEILEQEIAELQATLSTGEAELDERVTTYYGLDADDRTIIADFLKRF
ncbi:MAG: hypothetical protein H0X37_24815 [Herpetosiphonaceae bacterium]|nr:hypothetical protein [Herpetosiphonaceae bacterium]